MRLEDLVAERGRLVNAAIQDFLPRPSGDASQARYASSLAEYVDLAKARLRPSMAVYEPMRHVVDAGGKRIRPTLCLLACEAMGAPPERALPTAVGIEFLHTFTLVHDDIMDKDLLRRNRPTIGALWGDDVAITVGDGLFALAFKAFAANADVPGVDPARALSVMREAADTSLDLAQGQALDLLYAKRGDVTVDEYLEMIRLKTGVLLDFSLRAGAILGGGDARAVKAVSRFGAPLGLAFQIRDDLLGLVGDEGTLGKPVGSDLMSGKRTFPVCHALQHSPDAKRLLDILDAPKERTTPEMVAEALAMLREAGSFEAAKREAEARLAEAKTALAALPHGGPYEALGQVADFILARDR